MSKYKTLVNWQRGDKAKVLCEYKKCKRFLVVIICNESIGIAYHHKYGSFDFRNQIWYCYQHEKQIKKQNECERIESKGW